jgi:hypothetical protein
VTFARRDCGGGIVARAQGEHAVEGGLLRVRPGPGAGARGDEQAVEGDPPPSGELNLSAPQTQPSGCQAEQPFRLNVPELGQGGVLDRQPAAQDGLGQGRAIVRRVRLVADEGEGSGEPLRRPV